MENISLTHRIVGAIVILSLAIIFIPLLLETDQINPGNIGDSPIPAIPEEIETIVFELDDKSESFKPKNAEEIKQFEQNIKTNIEASTQEVELKEQRTERQSEKDKTEIFPVEVNKNFEHTWMLQLASFKNQDMATEFRDRLRKAGYTANMDVREIDSGRIWRVRVGPYVRKEEAQDVLAKVNKAFRVEGVLVQRR